MARFVEKYERPRLVTLSDSAIYLYIVFNPTLGEVTARKPEPILPCALYALLGILSGWGIQILNMGHRKASMDAEGKIASCPIIDSFGTGMKLARSHVKPSDSSAPMHLL